MAANSFELHVPAFNSFHFSCASEEPRVPLSPFVSVHQDLWWFCGIVFQLYVALTLIDWTLTSYILPLLKEGGGLLSQLRFNLPLPSLSSSQPSTSTSTPTSNTIITAANFQRTEAFPKHVAIIMDGNRRWATQRGLPKILGHKAGVDALELAIRNAYDIGLEHLTVYAFSTENWKRPKEEVDALLDLLRNYLVRRKAAANKSKDNIRINFIGDPAAMPQDIQNEMNEVMEKTAMKTGTTVHIAFNYGGRDEILRAIQRMGKDIAEGRVDPLQKLTEKQFVHYLDTRDIPDPDLLIRTSKEKRLSNFLLWELAYSEFAFCEKLWPDFTKNDLLQYIADFQSRHRRIGT